MTAPEQPYALAPRAHFVAAVTAAVAAGVGWAGGKIGFSEQHWLGYPMLLETTNDRRRVRAYEIALWHHFGRQSGVFPCTPEFAQRFVARHSDDLRQLDALGLFGAPREAALIRHYRLECDFVAARDMEPDRSLPSDEANCYLPAFRDRRLLLVAPFAELLRQRAERETFERVWARTGKRWFDPASVAAVEFPYGAEAATQARYGTVLNLFDEVAAHIDAVEFDVALIAASGLGIPLAAHVKRGGRLGLSLGGHLQVLFGVLGKRWRERESWRRNYFNDAWIDMPAHYRPTDWQQLSDGGAYW